jgi:hypothetical protein
MKTIAKTTTLLVATLGALAVPASPAAGQSRSEERPLFIGVQPMVTIEPFYESGEFDVNVLPAVVGLELSASVDLKIAPIASWQFGGHGGIRHLGAEINAPYYFRERPEGGSDKGFFGAPLVAYTRNLMDDGNEVTVGVEVGYTILFEGGTELKIGLQEGATFFFGNPDTEKTVNRFGIKISFGKWLSRQARRAR